MKKKIINGIVPILITPFDKKGKIEYNEKVQKTEKKVSKEEKVKKN